MTNELRFRASIKDDVSTTLEKISDRFGRVKEQGKSGFFAGVGAAATLKAFSLADQAIARTGEFLADAVQAARDEEVSIQKLTTSLAANVEGWDGNTEAIERTIKARMDLGFADDAQRDSLAKLVAATGDVNDALAIQRTAMDLARFKGIDLATATDALIKVESGQYRMLKTLGIVLEEGATQTEALAAVQKVAAGQAEAYMETSAGGAEELSVKMGELSEVVGQILLPVVDNVTDGLIDMADSLGTVTDESASLIDRAAALGDVLTDLNPTTWGVGMAMSEVDKRIPTRKMGELSRETADVDNKLADLEETTYDAEEAFDDLRDAVDDLTDDFLDAAFGADELRLELKDARDELGENEREAEKLQAKIRRFKESGKPVGELKDDLRDLRGEIIDDKKEIISTTSKLEAMGEVPMGSTKKEIERLAGPLDTAGDEAWNLYRGLYAASNVDFSIGGGGGPREKEGRAGGGQVLAGESYLVGENGPEILNLSSSSNGMVSPNAAGGASGRGGGSSLTINISTPALTPGGAQALADALAPSITRWQQQRGL
jgi:hypothetical protein